MSLRKKIWKRSGFLIRPIARWYFKKPRKWNYKGLELLIQPEVFFPQLTASTSVFIDYLDSLELKDLQVLDVGCGSGALSIFSAKKGAKVLAIDISPKAIENTRENALSNRVEIAIKQSDLFDKLDRQLSFDYVLINPPFYPKSPNSIEERAWYCGHDFQYFRKLFSELSEFSTSIQRCLMILSEDCELKTIKSIARDFHFQLTPKWEQSSKFEMHTIYELTQNKV